MKTITITWKISTGTPSHIIYYVDGTPVGEDNAGFDNVLSEIRVHKKIKVILKISTISSLGGDDLINTFPFKARFDDLKKALGGNKLVYEFF